MSGVGDYMFSVLIDYVIFGSWEDFYCVDEGKGGCFWREKWNYENRGIDFEYEFFDYDGVSGEVG